DVPDGRIFIDRKNSQLVIKQNNQWVPLNNMSNFELETTYKNNTGTFPINFAPVKLVGSADAVSGATGLTAGYLSPDTTKGLPTPTTMLIRVDFKISSTDTTDSDYYILGYEGSFNIRINPGKKTVSFYNAQTKSYSIDYSKLTINLHDDKFHTAYFILNNGYKGYTCFAIDGVYFNRELPTGNLYLTNLRVRGDKNNTVTANALTIKNLGISSKLPSLLNFQMVPTDFTEFEGYYTLINNALENKQLEQGILLKPYSNLDSLNTIIPIYMNDSSNNMAAFNEDGLCKGTGLMTTALALDTFTFECYFKYNSIYDNTATSSRRSIIGKFGLFSIGISANSSSKFTYKDYAADTETTLIDDIQKDRWHTLAISCKNNIASIFVDGVKKGNVAFNFSWNYIFFRGLGYKDYVPLENTIVIKNISMIVGQAKYYNDYDLSLTPNSPNSEGFFYPLINGIIANQNVQNPVVEINMNGGDSFDLRIIPNNGTPDMYADLIPIKYDYDRQPSLQNVKFSRIFLNNIQGNPVKGSV
ncbi:unnamed protein product, partial [Commensalibacter communis]|uniref:hypothetical protein n=1 Tax=Commensalibacter communis TaxID=2972786 RepID=UPI0022FF8DA1